MSSSDSGVILIAAPVIVAIGVVSMTGAAITAAAEKYRRFKLDSAEAEELEKRQKLDMIAALADENREEYRSFVEESAREEKTRAERENMLADAARAGMQEELRSGERRRAEIRNRISRMDEALRGFENEFGQDPKLREMADMIHRSESMFGDGTQLLQEIEDMLFVIIPGMSEERRRERRTEELEQRMGTLVSDTRRIQDSSENFISLHRGAGTGERKTAKTPWDSFVERVRAVAAVEAAYFEEEAAQMLAEAHSLAPSRRNFYIQQHQKQLAEMEERAEQYGTRARNLSEKVMDDFCMYLAIAGKLGIEPQYTEEDLTDPFEIDEMRRETEELVDEYRLKKEREYTVHAFTAVMKRHNLMFENMAVGDDGVTQVEYSMDAQTGVRITRARSGAFEMQFQGKSRGETASTDERRSITEKARHFCGLLPEIVKELEEEYGITFDQTALQPPTAENIEIRKAEGSARREKARAAKAMKIQ
ncbi:MAG: hypothetical protein Q4D81_04405 [Eubacteriales bacterium]|nr:hypothetical protein [Eubacteriales bacterium]